MRHSVASRLPHIIAANDRLSTSTGTEFLDYKISRHTDVSILSVADIWEHLRGVD